MDNEEYEKRIEEVIELFPKVIASSVDSAKLTKKVFSLIAKLRGENIGLILNAQRKTRMNRK